MAEVVVMVRMGVGNEKKKNMLPRGMVLVVVYGEGQAGKREEWW